MKYYFFILILLVFILFSCKKIKTVRPNCDAQVVEIRQDTSFLSTPIVISTKLIEEKINNSIKREVLNDTDFDNRRRNGKKDRTKMKVTRLGNIHVTWKNNVARFDVPLLILSERQIVPQKALRLSKSLSMKTEFSLRLVFETTLDLGEDWKLCPKTEFVNFEWIGDVRMLGGLVSLKKLVEWQLRTRMPEILWNMDSTIRTNIHLDRTVGRIWRNLQKPVIINRKETLIWLKIHPIRFEMGKITTESGNLLIQTRLSATTETIVGDTVSFPINTVLPPLVKRRSLPDTASVYFLSEIPYKDINALIEKKLVGKQFDLPGHRLVVKSAEVWGCGDHLMLRLSMGGDVRGDIYFQGIPEYQPDSQRIVIKNFNFEIKTEESLVASADWLLHETFIEQVKSMLSLELADKVLTIPQAIMQGIERGRAGKKLDFTIEKWHFRPHKIWVRSDDIAVLILVDARVRLELEKI